MIQWFLLTCNKEILKCKLVNSPSVETNAFIHPSKILFTPPAQGVYMDHFENPVIESYYKDEKCIWRIKKKRLTYVEFETIYNEPNWARRMNPNKIFNKETKMELGIKKIQKQYEVSLWRANLYQ